MMRGIGWSDQATLRDIGHAINPMWKVSAFCRARLLRPVWDTFHTAPSVLHYGKPGTGVVLEGMFFTIEPMVNAGRCDVKILDDGWTAVTRDHPSQRSSNTPWGYLGNEIFTHSPKGWKLPPTVRSFPLRLS